MKRQMTRKKVGFTKLNLNTHTLAHKQKTFTGLKKMITGQFTHYLMTIESPKTEKLVKKFRGTKSDF